ncbi:MAG TPA: tetratricopeptide repeat protein [Tepidisphaeraceae bacterium]|jgi:tetratricopeptide (TPR) repeat protein
MSREMDDSLHRQITSLTDEGNALADSNRFAEAAAKFRSALELVPDPKDDWDAATWIYASIGDVLFLDGQFDDAFEALQLALRCPNGVGNLFIHLRVGQIHFERNDMHAAAQELTLAYMGAGREIFEGEDPKYFNLLKQVLKPPIGQDEL